MGVTIIGTGKSLPELVVKNDDLAKLVETDNEWIIERTGIEERHISVGETALDLAVAAAKDAMEGIGPNTIDLVTVATVTPDALVPAMSALVKRTLNLDNAVAFDVNMACSGFIYGIWIAESIMKAGSMANSKTNKIKRALVIGVERLSRIVDWEDRNTCILFGDGAGCALLELDENRNGILGSVVRNYDDLSDTLLVGEDYIDNPFSSGTFPGVDLVKAKIETQKPAISKALSAEKFIKMHGTKVFKFAVKAVEEVMVEVFENTGVSPEDVKYYVPHQANMRIITAAAQRFNQPLEKFQVNIKHTGNVSAASIPMALSDLMASGKVAKGDKIMMVGFGGGLSAGAVLFEV